MVWDFVSKLQSTVIFLFIFYAILMKLISKSFMENFPVSTELIYHFHYLLGVTSLLCIACKDGCIESIQLLQFAKWAILHAFCRLHIFQSTISKNSFRNTIRVSNSLDQDQARRFVRPYLGSNCLQKLSADDTSRY